jgi:hypothetical protein
MPPLTRRRNAIVSGGDALMARLKRLKDAKADADEAYENLRLCHDAVRAMQDVQAREQAVMDTTASARAEAERMIAAAKADGAAALPRWRAVDLEAPKQTSPAPRFWSRSARTGRDQGANLPSQ